MPMKNDFSRSEVVIRFEKMLESNENWYYDSDDFCDIINHYLDINDLVYTDKALKYALNQHPENADIKIRKLDYLLTTERFPQAVELIKELKDVAATDTDFLICRAKYYSLTDRPETAIYYYKKALENQEDQDFIYGCIGSEHMNQNRYSNALEAFKKALSYNSEDEYLLESCVECFEELEMIQSCIVFLNEFIDKNPYSENAWFQLGLQYFETEEFDNALRAFDYAFVINHKSISALSRKAECLEYLGKFEEAILVYEEILELDDSPSFTHIKIGDVYNLLGQPQKALKEYLKSIHEDPQLDKSWAAASETYESMSLFNEALYYMTQAAELDLYNLDYLRQLAFLQINLGKYEEAIEVLKEITEIDKENFINWFGLTELYIIVGDYPQGIATIKEAMVYHKKVEFYFQLSVCHFYLNQDEKGYEFLALAFKKTGKRLKKSMLSKFPFLAEKAEKMGWL
jgi:tetratricopeptide (TPR) repeat protein